MPSISFQDPLHLAVMVQGRLAVDRPDALVVLTSNPGEEAEHYIALIQRVYSNKNDLTSFVGYITYRYRNVEHWSKRKFLPKFSSMELRGQNFDAYNPPVKFHFREDLIGSEDPVIYIEAGAATAGSGLTGDDKDRFFREQIGERVFDKAYSKILDLIDGRI